MYTRFFGLGQVPFSIAPDPRYVFMSESHREALGHLLYGLNGGGGFVLLTGEIGAGKTTVCRLFLEQIPPNCNVAYIFNPKQTALELLQSICDEFGVAVARRDGPVATAKDFVDALNIYLLATHAGHQNNVLIIDEAQNLSADVLEQLRLLTNLETNERKLLQIILIGQPELRAMLAKPELEQLAQRVIARFHLGALSAPETEQYIAHRMAVAGTRTRLPFSRRLMRRIHGHARGIPRRINLLCDRALLGAYAQGKHAVDARIVDMAAREVFDMNAGAAPAAKRRRRHAAGLVTAVLLLAFAALAWDRRAELPALLGSYMRLPPVQASRQPTQPPAQPSEQQSPPQGDTSGADRTQAVPEAVPSDQTQAGPETLAPDPAQALPETVPSEPPVQTAAPAAPVADNPAQPEPQALSEEVRDPAAAFRRLGDMWHVKLGNEDACLTARKQGVHCFAMTKGVSEIRQLGRPGILTLYDDQDRRYYGLLVGLGEDHAVLRLGDVEQTVTLKALARRWRGEFVTLWRVPAGYRGVAGNGDRGPDVDWLANRLATVEGKEAPPAGRPYDNTLANRIREFQATQGLVPDGVAGPQTFMRLAAAAGSSEPQLQADGIAAADSSRK